jgi:uncharacterized protein
MTLSIPAARSLFLAAQGLHQPPAPATETDVLAAIRRMNGLQIDTISVVARSQYLVLWSRLGSYEPRWLDDLLPQGAVFEYWSHALCLLPIEDFPLYRWRMLERAQGDLYLEAYHPKYKAAVHHVLEQIRANGAARSVDFPDQEPRAGQWWDRKPEKEALDHLFDAGILMIARRQSMQRVYDLRERVLPDWEEARALPREEAWRALAVKAVRALGVAFPRCIQWSFHDAFRHTPIARKLPAILAGLVEEGEILPVKVEGFDKPAYVHRELLERAAAGDLRSAVTTLLSPFDPVVRDRARTQALFDFGYRIEVYTPAPRRRYGYYTLPILHRGNLVGRLDPKAHRKEGVMEVKAIYLEPGVEVTDDLASSLAATLRSFAAWHGTPELLIRRSDPPELLERIRSWAATASE